MLEQMSECPFFPRLNKKPLGLYSTHCINHSSTDGHLGCVHLLAAVENGGVLPGLSFSPQSQSPAPLCGCRLWRGIHTGIYNLDPHPRAPLLHSAS